MIRLRPHHLLCLARFEGKGYSDAFIENMQALLVRLQKGERIEIVEGPDDICAPLRDTEHWHCTQCSVQNRDQVALNVLDLDYGETIMVTAQFIHTIAREMDKGDFEKACTGCQWYSLCYRDQL